jgi:hypothetical protein
MGKKKVTAPNSHDAAVEPYLTSESDLDIYEDLTEGENVGLFEPLEFFNLLYGQYEFVKDNKEKPLTVIDSLKKLKYNDKQKWFLLYHLCELIEEDEGNDKDTRLKLCRTRIEKERDRLEEKLSPENKIKQPLAEVGKFDFRGVVKPHLETLPDRKARIAYLYEVKTEYEQTVDIDLDMPTFGEKCELEIQKLKQLMALERHGEKQGVSPSEAKSTRRNSEFTTARQVLAVHYLLQYIKALNVNKTEIARFIEFLTGKNYDSIYKKVREPLKLKDSEAKKDLEFVKAYFLKLELSEIVRMIDDEIAESS